MRDISNVAIVLPSFNPDERMLQVISDAIDAGFSRIILVNDGSRPNTEEYFDRASLLSEVTLLTHKENMGKGAALKTAFRHLLENDIDFSGVVTTDSDDQYNVKDLVACAEAVVSNEMIVLGARDFSLPEVSLKSKLTNSVTSFIFKTGCKIDVADTQTGLRGIPKKYLPCFVNTKGDRYEYETNMLIDMSRGEIPFMQMTIDTVCFEKNKATHFRPIRDSARIYSQLMRYMLSSLISYTIDQGIFALANIILSSMPGVEHLTQIIVATACSRIPSSLFNFLFNKNVVFKKRETSGAFAKYYILCAGQIIVSSSMVFLLSALFNLTSTLFLQLFKIITDGVLYAVNFHMQREWVYKEKRV